eukprot:2060267-Rhodomonas_salina.1
MPIDTPHEEDEGKGTLERQEKESHSTPAACQFGIRRRPGQDRACSRTWFRCPSALCSAP